MVGQCMFGHAIFARRIFKLTVGSFERASDFFDCISHISGFAEIDRRKRGGNREFARHHWR